ncbi:glycoside hydrolase family 7 protein [Tulasnella calospora MUT 4182]|uniref:Glucanase n=1 Tax=Tulasnella calospora MUT 4182 TaxID=1051891 RepID=A0A0C3LIF6_9AGAM|nr:glycoside hydrolase family 7 protein [Tulasnella calospora MUT 4182]
MVYPPIFTILFSLVLTPFVEAQRYGPLIPEVHPALSGQKCTSLGSCVAQAGKIVLDANRRWYHNFYEGYPACYDGVDWHPEYWPGEQALNEGCYLEGISSYSEFGVTTSGNALRLQFVTSVSQSTNVGSRVYLMADDNTYATFKALAQEITFDVDVSNLPCGIAADVHFAEMAADGGIAESAGWNNAGAKYGTGYCGAQCPRDVLFIQGHPNFNGIGPTPPPPGIGPYGFCCAEMDLWQANSFSTVMAAHSCNLSGRSKCEDDQCGGSASSGIRYNGFCDPDGCDFNPYRMGNPSFYGSGKTIDTTKKFTVVTQFITDNGTPSGSLVEIRRKYIQNGVTISNAHASVQGVDPSIDSITPAYCDQQKTAFGDMTSFQDKGGLNALGDALRRGMVLVLSIYDDRDANMLWLDSQYPPGANSNYAGVIRGTCAITSGVPADVELIYPNSSVMISNIKFGPIGSTV